ncbi:MAG: glycerol-3-phosphate 1-O-acyltransferase PlsY [Planctomycetota bacterium]|nr:glycerol-3-phosphate 1-O-acyltransferase PlsY [Planctomycetota bacterium]
MSTPVYMVIACVVAYLVGGIPFGYVVGRLVGGFDIRQQGSGNIGATNVARVLGWKWGVAVLVPDALKGMLPVVTVSTTISLCVKTVEPGSVTVVHTQVLVGLIAILGHMYPCWIGLRGGKGVATALGVAIVLGPWATLVALVVYLLTLAIVRMGSLASLLAALSFAIAKTVLMALAGEWTSRWSLSAFTLAVPLMIVYRHRGNIVRIIRGEEHRMGRGGVKDRPPEGPLDEVNSVPDEP